jgi:glycine reductase
MEKIRVMHYINQFFVGIGGEEKAHVPPGSFKGAVGPGKRLQELLGDSAEIVVTAYCGDDYFSEHIKEVLETIIKMAQDHHVGLLVAGPAFASGRHGIACIQVCGAISNSMRLTCVTAMHPDNPGVEIYKQYKDKRVYAFSTTGTATGMGEALSKIAKFVSNLTAGSTIGSSYKEGYIPRGIRRDELVSKSGADRAVDMLLDKLAGRTFISEIPIESLERVPGAPRIIDLSKACLTLATSSGVIPKGNPDGFKAHKNVQWRKYSIDKLDTMKNTGWDVLHSGYNNVFMKDNPNYGVPLDVCRQIENEGMFAKLYPYFYTTSGCNASIPNMQRIGRGMAADMKAERIDGVLMVST